MNESRVSLIVPAKNEAGRIGSVIEAGLKSDLLAEVIVVDDGSTDNTASVATELGAILLRHETNQGKAEAMQTGYLYAKKMGSTALLFLDADLKGLNIDHIYDLVTLVTDKRAEMTIGILDRNWFLKLFLRKWGALSGQRALTIDAWERVDEQYKTGFKVEAALNATARHQGWHRQIRRPLLLGLTHTGQREKEPNLWRASLAYLKIYGSALLTYAEMELKHRRQPHRNQSKKDIFSSI